MWVFIQLWWSSGSLSTSTRRLVMRGHWRADAHLSDFLWCYTFAHSSLGFYLIDMKFCCKYDKTVLIRKSFSVKMEGSGVESRNLPLNMKLLFLSYSCTYLAQSSQVEMVSNFDDTHTTTYSQPSSTICLWLVGFSIYNVLRSQRKLVKNETH